MKRRKLTTEDSVKLFNRAEEREKRDNEIFDVFLRVKMLENVKTNTLNKYKEVQHVMTRDIEKYSIDRFLYELDNNDLEKLILEWKNERLSAATINGRLRVLKVYYRILKDKRLIKRNPLKNVKQLKENHQIKPILTDDEVDKINKEIVNRQTYAAFRDYVIFNLLINTGLRISECLNLTVSDLKMMDEEIVIRDPKNSKERVIYPSIRIYKLINKYIEVRGNIKNTDHLFITTLDTKLNKRTFQERLANYAKSAKVEKKVSPHMLRRTYAKNAIKAGMDVFTLAQLLGHSTLQVTREYAQLYGPDLKEQSKKIKDFL